MMSLKFQGSGVSYIKKHGIYGTITNFLLLLFIIITDDTYSRVAGIMALIGLNFGSKQFYNNKVVTELDTAVLNVTKEFLAECRKRTPNTQDMHIIIDAGWSHPGWWARECTVIAIDGKTNLPVEIEHIIKGDNYKGSSRGSFYNNL